MTPMPFGSSGGRAELLYDIEDEFGNGLVVLPCYWASAMADAYIYAVHDENGDFENGAVLYFWAWSNVTGASSYAFAKCFD